MSPLLSLATLVSAKQNVIIAVGDVDGWDLFDKAPAELRAEVTRLSRLAAMQARGPCLGVELNFTSNELQPSPVDRFRPLGLSYLPLA